MEFKLIIPFRRGLLDISLIQEHTDKLIDGDLQFTYVANLRKLPKVVLDFRIRATSKKKLDDSLIFVIRGLVKRGAQW